VLDYVDRNYTPNSEDLVCEYYVEPDGISLEKAAQQIAAESSIGTWTTISTMNKKVAEKLRPSVFHIDRRKSLIKIAYNVNLFEPGNIPQVYSAIAGNIYGMNVLKNLRLEDVQFPEKMVKSFPGPKFGIAGIRKLTGVSKRPLIGTIVKPKVGLNESEHANVAYESWVGGLDVVKDDENLTSMSFNKFEERIRRTLEQRDRAELETGEKKIYMPNITADTDTMIKRAEFVKENGGEYIMIDILTAGWSALQTIRDMDLGMVIHAHRAMHGALTRNHKHGISMLTIAKTARLLGCDQLHIGTAVGKMEGSAEEIRAIEHEVEDDIVHQNSVKRVLDQNWYGMKPTFAVCSGGLHAGMLPKLIKIMGTDIIAQFGGGCHWHPQGPRYGARGIRQAVEAVMAGESLIAASRKHTELAETVGRFGVLK
jgi:ribulose-bisphosphate carboxylase large chain